MSKSDFLEQGWLDHLFLNAAIATIGDASGLQPSAVAGSLYVALHTADPTDSGAQNANECSYGSYARVAVVRTASGWVRSGSVMSNVAAIEFPAATSGSETATHASIGVASSGASSILHSEALGGSLAISSGITPNIAIGGLTVTAS